MGLGARRSGDPEKGMAKGANWIFVTHSVLHIGSHQVLRISF